MAKQPRELLFADKATLQMLRRAETENIDTIWDRYDAVQPQCKFGALGVCCRICSMGPCRINLTPGKAPQTGACGANADTIAARNIARMIAAGTAALPITAAASRTRFLQAAEKPNFDYQIKNPDKLKAIAAIYDVKVDGRPIREIAKEVARAALEEFGRYEGRVADCHDRPEGAPGNLEETRHLSALD